jgi:hypothetical protein
VRCLTLPSRVILPRSSRINPHYYYTAVPVPYNHHAPNTMRIIFSAQNHKVRPACTSKQKLRSCLTGIDITEEYSVLILKADSTRRQDVHKFS